MRHRVGSWVRWTFGAGLVVTASFIPRVADAQTRVCVEVVTRSWAQAPPTWTRPAPGPEPGAPSEPDAPPDDSTPDSTPAEPEIEPPAGFADDDLAPEAALPGALTRNAQTVPETRPAPTAPAPGRANNPRPVQIRVRRPDEPHAPAPPVLADTPVAAQAYLLRLFEHYVTHAEGTQAVQDDCAERLTVELYPVPGGWTVFARYTGHAREEKIDRVAEDEFDALAQRLTLALLRDVSVQETLTRTTVLAADSEAELPRIRGGKQFMLGLGAVMLFGLQMPTSVDAGGSETLDERFRLIVPLQIVLGMRSFYRAWALDSFLGVRVGSSRRSSSTAASFHVDYTAGFTAGLHFLRYLRPEAVSSFYLGGGASFAVDRYRATGLRGDGLWGGGMHLDLVVGHEFMRASSLHFFAELTASMPAYRFDTERDGARLNTYIPTAILQIGLLH